MTATTTQAENILARVNRKLADRLQRAPLELATGGGAALADRVWCWGIVGGKEVGKTTLINALAGATVAEGGEAYGEGTWQPTVYLTAADVAVMQARWRLESDLPVCWRADAPIAMHHLALVDLPDFDSLFTTHLETVRRITPLLDGIIWVTSPKKLGDLRAIREIERVLKARSNFAYVVNKMDWLVAQSDQPPQDVFERTLDALREQLSACADADDGARTFLVAARYPDAETMVAAMAASRNQEGALNGALHDAAASLTDQFARLRQLLTTAPAPENARASKQANLQYQVGFQATQLEAYYQPAELKQQLQLLLNVKRQEEALARYLPPAYFATVGQRLNSPARRMMPWAVALFRQRVAAWSLLGLIAWPCLLVASWLQDVREWLGGRLDGPALDPLRVSGVDFEERVEGVRHRVRARMTGRLQAVPIEWPDAAVLAATCRGEVLSVFDEQREAVFEALRSTPTGGLTRAARRIVPWVILLWFTLVQPLCSALLDSGLLEGRWSLDLVRELFHVLSPAQLLVGLGASAVVLAIITSMVFSRAVRDADRACEQLSDATADQLIRPLELVVMQQVIAPLRRLEVDLDECLTTIQQLHKGV